jgi:hypothetical protein
LSCTITYLNHQDQSCTWRRTNQPASTNARRCCNQFNKRSSRCPKFIHGIFYFGWRPCWVAKDSESCELVKILVYTFWINIYLLNLELAFYNKIRIRNVFNCFFHISRNTLPGVIPYVLIAVFFFWYIPEARIFPHLQLTVPRTLPQHTIIQGEMLLPSILVQTQVRVWHLWGKGECSLYVRLTPHSLNPNRQDGEKGLWRSEKRGMLHGARKLVKAVVQRVSLN